MLLRDSRFGHAMVPANTSAIPADASGGVRVGAGRGVVAARSNGSGAGSAGETVG